MPRSKTPVNSRALNAALTDAWQRRGLLACALWPISLIMRMLVALRRALYRYGWLQVVKLPVPVIVVGNITVGGAGKTPLTIHLVESLRQQGKTPGVISRGYGRVARDVREVLRHNTSAEVGDEPLLIQQRTGVPVVVGRDRAAAGRALLAAHPEVNVLLCDDGLQHYALHRDIELAVFDARGVMNAWLLPAGPLREPLARLAEVDALIFNASAVPQRLTFAKPSFLMRLKAGKAYRLGWTANNAENNAAISVASTEVDSFRGPVHALAGIGHPQRFFDQLTGMGLTLIPHAFPDHHHYTVTDLPQDGRPILTTEKDAVKLQQLLPDLPATLEIWVLPVAAQLDPELICDLMKRLEKFDGPPPA